MKIAIIPARGGSKRIPRKNIKMFASRPMIAWPIKVALESGLFDHVIVSTDDAQIAEIARENGADVPFMRPADLAGDITPTRPVLLHALEYMEAQEGREATHGACLYATAAFLKPVDLQTAFECVEQHGGFAFGAISYPHPVQRAFRQLENGGVEMMFPEHRLTRTQDLETLYHDAGMFHLGTREALFSNEPVFSKSGQPVLIPPVRGYDIDEPEDWERAELAFQMMHGTDDTQHNNVGQGS